MNRNLPEGRYCHFEPGNGGSRNRRCETQDRIHYLQKKKSLQYVWIDNMHMISARGMIKCDKLFPIKNPNRVQNVTMNEASVNVYQDSGKFQISSVYRC